MELKKYKKIDAITLKYLAMFMMLLDHLWATIVPGNDWMNYIGRLAFPIFAFQIVEGYFHTKDYKQYLKRLFIFALISEIPFNLMASGSYIYPFGQNVIFTFIYGIVSIQAIEEIIKHNHVIKNIAKVLLMMILSIITFHSLEDRMVKLRFKEYCTGCTCPPDFPVCVCGKTPRGELVSRKPIVAGKEELENNSRSRSAKLRAIRKL